MIENIGVVVFIGLIILAFAFYGLAALIYEFMPEIDEYFDRKELKHWQRVHNRAIRRKNRRINHGK